MEMSNSGANCAVSHAQMNRRSLGSIETYNSDFSCRFVHEKQSDKHQNN